MICPICGSSRVTCSDRIYASCLERDLVQCKTCGLHFFHPLPDVETLEALYRQALEQRTYVAYEAPNLDTQYPDSKMCIAGKRFSDQRCLSAWICRFLAAGAELLSGRMVSFTLGVPLQYPHNAAILDVGCGAGGWLLAMRKRGYRNLYGQDIVEAARGLNGQGISILVSDLAMLELPQSTFDLIRMEHVLEHIPDPISCFQTIRRILKPGGRLVITTPAIESFSFRLRQQSWPALEYPYHLYFYTAKSLKCLGDRVGLILRRHRYLPILEQAIKLPQFIAPIARPFYTIIMKVLKTGDFLSCEYVKPT